MTIEKSNQIRNKEVFTFLIDRKDKIITDNRNTIVSDCEKYQLFIDGVIYNHNTDRLISGFVSEGADYVSQLEGNFLIFLVVDSSFHILTDKINSRKAFYAFIDDKWYISNNIDCLPKNRSNISIDGVACYIANGVMLNNLTLFQNIKQTKRASIHRFENDKISIHRYWDLSFSHSSEKQIDEKRCKIDFKRLLIDAVKIRYNKDVNTGISLSAGYDVRGILGILHESIKASGISCFSYALNDHPKPGTDAFVSKKIADEYQFPHDTIKTYKGNLIEFLINNAFEGKCLTNFSDELDAWHYLAEKGHYNDIFVGDMAFGIGGNEKSINDILRIVQVRSPSGFKWLKHYLSKKVYNDIYRSIKNLNSSIIRTVEVFPHLQDKKDYLYFDQRLNHVQLPWRENICGQAGFVHIPYLDGEVLNFISKLPMHLRKGKSLYRETIIDMYPDLFSIPRAEDLGYKVNWAKEIAKNRKALIKLNLELNSRLDEFISKEEILYMIKRINPVAYRIRLFLVTSMNYLRRKINAFDKLLENLVGPMQRRISPDLFLIRILLIRIYLSDTSYKRANIQQNKIWQR